MPSPFSLLPLAVAAHGGRVDDHDVQQLVAAGLTLLQRSAPLVRALSGKRAAILLPSGPAFFVALAAAEGRGAVLINPLASAREIAHQLRDANVGAVFTTTALAARVPSDVARVLLDSAPRTARVVATGMSRDVDLGSHVGLEIEGDTDVAGSEDEAAIVYTSAMAGTPLGAVLSHRNLLANARSTITAVGNHGYDCVLALLPFTHLFGLTVSAVAPLLAGGAVVTMPRFNPGLAVELLASGRITEIVGVPVVFRALLAALERRGSNEPLPRLRVCVCGGAPLTVELQERWFSATGVELRQGYGLTEAGPVCLFNRIDQPNVRGTLGVPFPGVDVDLRTPVTYDSAGRPCLDDGDGAALSFGEIAVRGESVFRGYLAAGSSGLPVAGGWLRTGDLGRRNDDGTISFAGVVKPMFTRNGFNIYPHEIERVVAELPGVETAVVAEQTVEGREPEISLTVRGAVDTDTVTRWCADSLSAYKQPTVIRIL
jgi:long-chain acyl-CoA synthetase